MKRLRRALATDERAHRHVASSALRPALGGRVAGVIESFEEWAAETPGASYETLHRSRAIERRPPKTLEPRVDPIFARKSRTVHPEVFRAVVPSGGIAGLSPVVLSEDKRVFAESTFGGQHLEANPVLRRRLHRPRRLRGAHGVLVGAWYFNYYHWMIELLPRVSLLDGSGHEELPVIVPEHLSAAQLDLLELVGVSRERMVPFDHPQLVVDELVFPSLIGTSGSPPAWAMQWLRDRLSPAGIAATRRLFVSRARATGPVRRRVVNEEAVLSLLEPLGFERVQPELLPLRDQLRLFAEAEVVVAPHGAGLTNMVAARGATLVELHAREKVRLTYYALADLLDFDYWYQLCEPHANEDLLVDVEQLARTLEAALTAPEGESASPERGPGSR